MLKTLFFLLCLIETCFAYGERDEQKYLNDFEFLIKDSYSADRPNELDLQCKATQPFLSQNLTVQSITTSTTSEQVQQICGTSTICSVEKGVTITMNSNLNVAALVVKGNLTWNDKTQNAANQWLCAGYIAVKKFHLTKINFIKLIKIFMFLQVEGGEFTLNVVAKKSLHLH